MAADRHDALGLEGLEAGGVDGFAAGDDVGSDSFTYKLTDSYSRDSNTATVSITVNPLVAASMSAGYDGSCAVLTDSTARCWGLNSSGQLGNNSTTQSKVPVKVVNPTSTSQALTGFASISGGNAFNCAAMTDGTARCWCGNGSGQLGNNATLCSPGDFRRASRQNDSKTPVAVLDPTDTTTALGGIDSIASTNNHTCAVMTDGSARCWGLGLVGQLGNNATADAPTPVTVSAWG